MHIDPLLSIGIRFIDNESECFLSIKNKSFHTLKPLMQQFKYIVHLVKSSQHFSADKIEIKITVLERGCFGFFKKKKLKFKSLQLDYTKDQVLSDDFIKKASKTVTSYFNEKEDMSCF